MGSSQIQYGGPEERTPVAPTKVWRRCVPCRGSGGVEVLNLSTRGSRARLALRACPVCKGIGVAPVGRSS